MADSKTFNSIDGSFRQSLEIAKEVELLPFTLDRCSCLPTRSVLISYTLLSSSNYSHEKKGKQNTSPEFSFSRLRAMPCSNCCFSFNSNPRGLSKHLLTMDN